MCTLADLLNKIAKVLSLDGNLPTEFFFNTDKQRDACLIYKSIQMECRDFSRGDSQYSCIGYLILIYKTLIFQ